MDARAIDAALAELEDIVGDPSFAAELLGDFLDALPDQLAALRTATETGDLEQLHRGAHTLRSNAATFGATDLAVACRALEQAAGDGATDVIRERVARVDAEAELVMPQLAAARNERFR